MAPADFQAITTAILTHTSDDTVIVAMLVGAGLESGWRINAPGGGAFQITGSRTTIGQAITGTGSQIDADVQIMLPRYEAAAIVHRGDPESADKYANIAHDAEKPAKPYQQSQGEAKVQSVYATVSQNYGSVGATGQGQVKTVIGGQIGLSFLAPVLSALSDLTDVHMWRSISWIVIGALILIVGLVLWLKKPLESAVGSIAKAAV